MLRSFPSQVFGGPTCSALTARVEDLLIDNRACFQILYDHQLDGLRRGGGTAGLSSRDGEALADKQPVPPRALVLAGCVAMGDGEVEAIRRFVASGGRVCAIGPVATHDRWMRPRPKPALDDLPDASVVRVKESADWMAAIRTACGGTLSLSIASPKGAAPAGLCAELTEQPGRRLVHLVNYRGDGPIGDLDVAVQLPHGTRAKSVRLASPDRPADRSVAFEESPAAVRFTVPEVKVYEIAVVEFSGP